MITIEAPADSLSEQPETFALTIGQGTGDAAPATAPTAVVTIRDPAQGPGAEPGPGPGGAGTGGSGGGPGVDRDAPVIGAVTLAPTGFAVGRGSTRAWLRAARRSAIRCPSRPRSRCRSSAPPPGDGSAAYAAP